MSTDPMSFNQKPDETMSFLEAFNHLGRHSLRKTGVIAEMQRSKYSAIQVYTLLFLPPIIGTFLKQDIKMLFAAAAVTAGYTGAGYVYNRIERQKPLGAISSVLSKWDIPLFLGGNAYMLSRYVQDIFAPSSASSMGDPALILMAGAAFWSALPDHVHGAEKESDKPPSPSPAPPTK